MIVTFTIKNLVFRIDHFKLSFSSFNFVLNLEILFSNTEVYIWYVEHMFVIAPSAAYVGKWIQSLKDFPPRQRPGSFNLDRVMEAVTNIQQ